MNEELSVKFDLSAADNTLSEMWDEPASSKKEYLRTGLTYLVLVGMMCYYKTPWQRQVIGLTAIAGFSFLFSKVMRWIVLRWGFRRDLLKTSEIIARVELIFSDKGVSYQSEKAVGSFDWCNSNAPPGKPGGFVLGYPFGGIARIKRRQAGTTCVIAAAGRSISIVITTRTCGTRKRSLFPGITMRCLPRICGCWALTK